MSDTENNAVAEIGQASYVIFACDNLASPDGLGIGFRRVSGAYRMADGPDKGKLVIEPSYIVNANDWPAIVASGLVCRQESVLVLGPRPDRDGPRPATLHFLPKEGPEYSDPTQALPIALGYFLPCSIERAKREDAYTIDAANELGYICSFELDAGDEE